MSHELRQIRIVQLSDIHFGSSHRFAHLPDAGGNLPAGPFPTSLFATLLADWSSMASDCPVVIAVTGDLTQRATAQEFTQARDLLDQLTKHPVLGQTLSRNELFIIPGNHDVVFTEADKGRRWQPYCSFYQEFFSRMTNSDQPEALNRIHNRSADLGIVVAELNSCVYIQQGVPDQDRGQVDLDSIQSVRDQLEEIDRSDLERSIRIALIHHHVVLLPMFAEPGRNYDSVIQGGELLTILREYGFHLVLHGHKHNPHTFSYDPEPAWTTEDCRPILILAGGSAGSRGLPDEINSCNTYNLITVKWNPHAREARVEVQTRGLATHDQYGRPALPRQWRWTSLRTVDRLLSPSRFSLKPGNTERLPFTQGEGIPNEGTTAEQVRKDVYTHLRCNMPVVEIVPSLASSQAYEARVCIVAHRGREVPAEVIWSAGDKFEMARCVVEDNPNFVATFSYYGPMLIQVRMRFRDGRWASGYVYAPLPSE